MRKWEKASDREREKEGRKVIDLSLGLLAHDSSSLDWNYEIEEGIFFRVCVFVSMCK